MPNRKITIVCIIEDISINQKKNDVSVYWQMK